LNDNPFSVSASRWTDASLPGREADFRATKTVARHYNGNAIFLGWNGAETRERQVLSRQLGLGDLNAIGKEIFSPPLAIRIRPSCACLSPGFGWCREASVRIASGGAVQDIPFGGTRSDAQDRGVVRGAG
jgi:hypothetical protein